MDYQWFEFEDDTYQFVTPVLGTTPYVVFRVRFGVDPDQRAKEKGIINSIPRGETYHYRPSTIQEINNWCFYHPEFKYQ